MFEDLGIKYVGPVDGHDVEAMEHALRRAKAYGAPVIVHAITEKGRGYTPAEQDVADRFHAVGKIHPETGLPVAPSRFGWTSVFADEIVQIGRRRSDVVAITAAMLEPVGLKPFAQAFPERTFDVGIAEQHAATSAAGMAFAGLHPVVAVYATFLNRAFDQVLMDVALHKAGVTFVLDRAGITGDDGASHNGMWDMAMLRIVPGLRLAAPRDEETLRTALREAVDVDDAPTVVRYPKGALGDALPAVDTVDGVDLLAVPEDAPKIAPQGAAPAPGSCSSAPGPWRVSRSTRRRRSRPTASTSPSRPHVGPADAERARQARRRARPRRERRGRRRRRRRGRAPRAALARGRRPHARARARPARAVPRPRDAGPGGLGVPAHAGRRRARRAGRARGTHPRLSRRSEGARRGRLSGAGVVRARVQA